MSGSVEASAALAKQARATRVRIQQAQTDAAAPWATTLADPPNKQIGSPTQQATWQHEGQHVAQTQNPMARIKIQTSQDLYVGAKRPIPT